MQTVTASPAPSNDARWSSSGMGRREAIGQWQDWAARTIAPIDVSVRDIDRFVAGWRSYGLGDLRFLHLLAPAQRVIHRGTGSSGQAAPSIQLVYARRGALRTQIGRRNFTIGPGEFVLLDNTRFYQMDMDSAHEAIDLMMPRIWVEHWLPDPDQLLGRPLSTRTGWGAPLGSLLEAMARHIDDSPLMRPLLAERVGALLTLAAETGDRAASGLGGGLADRILRRIERDFADPDLAPQPVADALGISKRYLQALLAARGTSFVQELGRVRLERACDLLAESGLPVAEIAFRCGFLDPGYFARQFRRRFGATPRDWRTQR
ncbi:AraC family transcriptional regulator [Sphingomonas oligophenolica]|uniref:AraC family transcriptional regulator n=1 Tax=Sphingomonas oligophenolica TaxID=301154 RepID=A0ABU9XYE9_9SPHN